jgi:type IV pilus assembly protein PilE
MKGKEGVTLIEVMVVVAIVGLLAAIAIPAYNDYVTRSRRSDAFTALETVRAAQEMYRAERGFYIGINYLAGCSSNMAGDNYTISVATGAAPATTFTVTATPTSGGSQKKDFCFQINQDGNQSYAPYTSSTNTCGAWQSDKKFEDLR